MTNIDDEQLATEGVGRRVRAVRKLAGLTQEGLANRMHMSLGMVRQVEQGRAPASPSFIAAAARALRVSVPELYGQAVQRPDVEQVHLADLETAVMAGVAPAEDRPPAEGVGRLAVRVDEVAELQRRGRYDVSSGLLLGLLDDLHAATLADRRAHSLLSRGYLLASLCLHRLGSPVAAQAGARAVTAALLGDAPLRAAVADVELGMRVLHRGAYGAADRLAARARATIADLPGDVPTLSVRGHTHLSAAITAARAGDADASTAHLDEARDCAAHVPDGLDLYDTAFGPSNVTMHRVAAAVEMSDGTTAIERNAPLGDAVMPSRRAHHQIDLARAYLLHGDRERTLASLQEARAAAPQVTRHHPQVVETVRVLAERDRRRTDTLAGFARWAGVAV